MKAALIPTIIFILLCGAIGWVGYQEAENMKALAGLGDEDQLYGRKSIMEDIAYWFFPAKWDEYQQERLNRQRERNATAPAISQYETSLEALAAKRPLE